MDNGLPNMSLQELFWKHGLTVLASARLQDDMRRYQIRPVLCRSIYRSVLVMDVSKDDVDVHCRLFYEAPLFLTAVDGPVVISSHDHGHGMI
jgi:hypothetical protein